MESGVGRTEFGKRAGRDLGLAAKGRDGRGQQAYDSKVSGREVGVARDFD